MNCNDIELKIVDYVDGNLSETEVKAIDKHIQNCNACKVLKQETLQLLNTFNNVETVTPSENVRTNFYKLLEEEKQLQNETKVVELKPKTNELLWKRAFQIAASFLLVFLGFFMGNNKATKQADQQIATLQKETVELRENMMLAMIENKSPSMRIQAVNYTEQFKQPDTKILKALIERLNYDSNVNVRLAAAEALSEFSESNLVKDAFINALKTQEDPGLQIAIIQFLVKIQDKRAIEPIKELLQQPETPDFVKDQANYGLSELI